MRRFHLGFTTRASCLTAAGVTALLCGLVLGEIDLMRAGVLALAVPLVSAFVVYRSRVRLTNRRSVEPSHATAGEGVVVHLTLTNRSPLPIGALMLEDQLPAQVTGRARFTLDGLGGRESRVVSYRLPALGRGRYRTGPLRIRITDPFHMIDVTRSFAATREFLVAPVVDPLPTLDPPRSWDVGDNAGSHSIGSRGADDASTREYRTGDDLRKIHWRSSARIGALMVRQEERPWQGQTTLVLDTRVSAHASLDTGTMDAAAIPADPRQRHSVEWAISTAASIGSRMLLSGRPVSLVSDPAQESRLPLADPLRLTDHLAGLRPSPRTDLTRLVDLLRASARDSVMLAVLGALDPESLRVLAECHPRGGAFPAFAVLLDVQSWSTPEQPPVAGAGTTHAARLLGNAGWRLVVARRGDTAPRIWRALLGAGRGVPAAVSR